MRAAGLPRPSATARTALPEPHKPRGGAGIPAGLPRTPRAPNAAPGGRERSELPRRAARSRPGAARAPLPLRSVLKHPFPERDSRAEPRIPPAHLGRERGSVPRLRPAAPPPPLAPPDRTEMPLPRPPLRPGRVGSIPQEGLSPPRAPRNDPHPLHGRFGLFNSRCTTSNCPKDFSIPPPLCLLSTSRSLCSTPEQLYLCYPAGVTHPGQGHPDTGAANYGQEEEQGEADSSHTC